MPNLSLRFFFTVSAFSAVNIARKILLLQPSEHSDRGRFVGRHCILFVID